MCSATVQSLNHVRAMTVYKKAKPKDGGVEVEVQPLPQPLSTAPFHSAFPLLGGVEVEVQPTAR